MYGLGQGSLNFSPVGVAICSQAAVVTALASTYDHAVVMIASMVPCLYLLARKALRARLATGNKRRVLGSIIQKEWPATGDKPGLSFPFIYFTLIMHPVHVPLTALEMCTSATK